MKTRSPGAAHSRRWIRPQILFTINNHGFSDGELFQFFTSGTAPSPLTSWNPYYIRDATQNTFKLCSTQGGSAIDLTSKGTGTHYFREYMHAWSSIGENSNSGQASFNSFAPGDQFSMFTALCPMPPPKFRD